MTPTTTTVPAAPVPAISGACQVLDLSPLSANTFLLTLQWPASSALNYRAGQYLQLTLDLDNRVSHTLCYSIANSFNPACPRRLQLFIQNTGPLTAEVLRHLAEHKQNKTPVVVRLPMGRAFLQTDLTHRHLLIAAGSGIAKIKCLTEAMLTRQASGNMHIYWSNKNSADFYLIDQFKHWADTYKNLHFTAILESANSHWNGRTGYIFDVIQQDFSELRGARAYLCGSPQMVYGTIDKLQHLGLAENSCYSDVFEYAPRQQPAGVQS